MPHMKKLRSLTAVLLLTAMLSGLVACRDADIPAQGGTDTHTAEASETSTPDTSLPLSPDGEAAEAGSTDTESTDPETLPTDTDSSAPPPAWDTTPPGTTAPGEDTEPPPAEDTTVSVTEAKPAEDITPPAEDPLPPPAEEIPADTGRLIYYEDFESYPEMEAGYDVLQTLGWMAESRKTNAYEDCTAKCSIKQYNKSQMLAIANNLYGAEDSYITLLSSAQMGKYHEQNYTYQYDMIYGGATKTNRYIALVNGYNGSFYHSFLLRNAGDGNNLCHINGEWVTYDGGQASATDDTAIVKKLLGYDYTSNAYALQYISFSVRYVVDWEAGNSVYIRINEEGYPGSGIWTLVSKGSASEAFDPYAGGAGIVLKVGGTQDGYIDNIMIWEGTGEPPADKSHPLLVSGSEGCSGHHFMGDGSCLSPRICLWCGAESEKATAHKYLPVSGTEDARCDACYALRSNESNTAWPFPNLPAYTKGRYAENLYLAGHGIDDAALEKETEGLVLVISDTTQTDLEAYGKILDAYGYNAVYRNGPDMSGSLYLQYAGDGAYYYLYYTGATGEARIVYDPHSHVSPHDFGYTYEKKPGNTTVIYQYGLPMSDSGAVYDVPGTNLPNNGMMYILKLADNSVLVIDGGRDSQADTAWMEGLMTFLEAVTGTSPGEKVKIAGWFLTHSHIDHRGAFMSFIEKYHHRLDFDRLFFNFPSVNSTTESVFRNAANAIKNILSCTDRYLREDGIQFIKLHNGQKFSLADISVSVLYTHEDLVNENGLSEAAGDLNNAGTVITIEFDGKKFLVGGDINRNGVAVLTEIHPAEALKCDVVQVLHHTFNTVPIYYNRAQATVVLVPQSEKHAYVEETGGLTVMNTVKQYAAPDMIFFEGDETTGIAVVNGTLQKVYSEEIHYEAY